jgi:hypothetical protein
MWSIFLLLNILHHTSLVPTAKYAPGVWIWQRFALGKPLPGCWKLRVIEKSRGMAASETLELITFHTTLLQLRRRVASGHLLYNKNGGCVTCKHDSIGERLNYEINAMPLYSDPRPALT